MLKLGLCNYYGGVCLEEIGGKWYLSLGNWDEDRYIEVSEKFAKAVKEEFSEEKEVITYTDLFGEED